MTWLIRITGGKSAGNEYVANKAVIRIGSDTDSDLLVPSLPSCAVTLRSRDGVYDVFPRCDATIRLNGRALTPDSWEMWRPGVLLRIGKSDELVLEQKDSAGDQGSARRPASPSKLLPVLDEEEPGAGRGRAAAIVVVTVLLMFALLATRGKPHAATSEEFRGLIVELQAKVLEDDAKLATVRQLVQEGRVMDLRGQSAEAFHQYTLARKVALEPRRPSDPLAGMAPIIDLEKHIVEVLNDRILVLAPKAD